MTTDGEKERCQRESEFENDMQTRGQVMSRWQAGWGCLLTTLDELQEADWQQEIFIRNMGHSVVEAIKRQLVHYPCHVGQIVFLGKMGCHEQWLRLSIPGGDSQVYNVMKFAQPKRREHFTDERLQ